MEIGNGVNSYNQEAKWFDHIAFSHDVHVVIGAGNDGSLGVKGAAMAYNAITVGRTMTTTAPIPLVSLYTIPLLI